MSLQSWASLCVAVLLLAAHGVLAAAKSAYSNSRRSRLRQMALDEVPRAQLASELAEDSSRMLGTLHLGKALLLAFALAVASLILVTPLAAVLVRIGLPDPWAGTLSLMVVVCAFAIIQLILGRLVPEAVAAANPEQWALRFALLVRILELGLWPLVRLTVWVSNHLAAPFGGAPLGGLSSITEEEIKTLVDAGEEEGVFEGDEREMIYSIFEFSETMAREVMVPRIDMVALRVNTKLDKALMAIIEAGHSRIPVYEGTVDHIVGLLYAKDLLVHLGKGDAEAQLSTLLRPAYFVPETKKVDDLLREMQKRRVHLTVVVDEYGGTAGLVTIEDILEEIVGEIQDEYDAEEPVFEQISENEYVLDARMDLDDVNNLLQTDLPTEVSDTLGGLIYSSLGKVPAPGERLRMDGLLIEVLTVTGRRISKVRLIREPVEGDNG